MSRWQSLGSPPPNSLAQARLDAHYSAQIPSSAGVSLLDPAPDDSHSNLGWSEDLRALVGRPVPQEKPFQAALRISDLTLLLLDAEGMSLAEFSLRGQTLAAGYEWINGAVASHLGRPASKTISPRPLELPSHSLTRDTVITTAADALEELARWYADADALIDELIANDPNASEVRCWPHHFDIASLISLDPGGDPETSRSIGVGMSPGDGSYDEPYFYINPWPAPPMTELPPLEGGGHWHTEGWVGAVLPAVDLIADAPGAKAQAGRAKQFSESAIHACRTLLG